MADYDVLGHRQKQIAGPTITQYEEKYFQLKLYIEPIYPKTRTTNIKVKHRMLGIDERMEKMLKHFSSFSFHKL